MEAPLQKPTPKPAYLDVSPERLEAMSPSQLAEAMEQALEAMTEEDYDSEIIDAYLEALDRKAPLPEQPNAETGYADFQQRLRLLSPQGEEPRASQPAKPCRGLGRVLRFGLTAALVAALMLGSMVMAQAAGVDVFGAMAHWTADVFGFGALPQEAAQDGVVPGTPGDVPEELLEYQAAVEKRGLPLYFPKVPEGYQVFDSQLFIRDTGNMEFSIGYIKGDDCIGFDMTETDGQPSAVYEKDDGEVELYECGGVTHYIFTNMDSVVAAWMVGDVEYDVSNRTTKEDLKALIRSIYGA